MKVKGKTFDGYKIKDIVSLLESFGADIRSGKRHSLVARTQDQYPFNCAIGNTTGFKKHILPWIHKAYPQYTNMDINQSLGRSYA